MEKKFRLDKNDCDDIGFTKSCLIMSAVSFEEFKNWIMHVIEVQDDVPTYFFDVLDIKEKFDFKPISIMGFNPYWSHSDVEDNALIGIAYKRRLDYVNDSVSRERALEALSVNPHIEQRFRETFPFIDF